MLDLHPPARVVAALLDGVRDDQLSDPTPCARYPVAALLDHLMGLTTAFTLAARKSTAAEALAGESRPGEASAAHLSPGWRTELPRRLRGLAEAWQDPGAWEGMAAAGGVTLPADVMGAVAVDELVIHGWDLARATGQRFTCDAASTQAVFTFTSIAARPEEAEGRQGVFGPVVEVPADAPLLERALGLSGRDPAWSPQGAQHPTR
ncbi:MAG TPA: TIGR03086 family metal-binding protein [Jiangellales bacterium]|nr:TIGR03086 family metal-binding protein [Jiangellales bacterium]